MTKSSVGINQMMHAHLNEAKPYPHNRENVDAEKRRTRNTNESDLTLDPRKRTHARWKRPTRVDVDITNGWKTKEVKHKCSARAQ